MAVTGALTPSSCRRTCSALPPEAQHQHGGGEPIRFHHLGQNPLPDAVQTAEGLVGPSGIEHTPSILPAHFQGAEMTLHPILRHRPEPAEQTVQG